MQLNPNFLNLETNYLFSEISKKVRKFKNENPNNNLISLGIGDVTLPICKSVIDEIQSATLEMADAKTFKGYASEQGYDFLRLAILRYYGFKNVSLEIEEIFISDGSKSDIGNILDLFSSDNTVLIPTPVYPVYVDTNIMQGRKIHFIEGSLENDFLPMPDFSKPADIIYLCSPNNPTGAVYNFSQLKIWVDYALEKNAIILFDSAYEAFITDENYPTSIFQIDGARKCAIEFCSLSKTAGFTGLRCGYTVIPNELFFAGKSINKMWLRRQCTKFNGVSYIVQRGALAVFSEIGLEQNAKNMKYYLENAKIISKTMLKMNIYHVGGENSPYIWFKCPSGMKSWEFFDKLLDTCEIVGTPGVGFGDVGEGYFRFSSFANVDDVKLAMARIIDNFN